ncbi:MAG: hypothetical protein AB4080_08295 [Trichodesmium sp.]
MKYNSLLLANRQKCDNNFDEGKKLKPRLEKLSHRLVLTFEWMTCA